MGMFFFYNNRKPRSFNYKPILYNPEEEERKERLNKRISEIKKEIMETPVKNDEEQINPTSDIRGEFLSQTKHLKRRVEKEESGSRSFLSNNGLLILILVILFAIFFFWILT
ncbi:MAG: hypothetical protein KBA24_04715 [Dysgonomonadaceae bacterium]|nr:hypothetical protein [Dysgonamonadaceae bacterium]